MHELLTLGATELAGYSFDCECGRRHSVDIKSIVVGSGCLPKVTELARAEGAQNIFLMADSNTYGVCGGQVEALLNATGFSVKTFVFQTEHKLVPDEKALGRLLIELSEKTHLIVSVGSGTLNDLARMLSFKLHIPYFIVATAPSMDGFASVVSPLIVEKFKITYECIYPAAIIADTSILKNAPMEMIQSGFGDIIGKYTALADWRLARELTGEYFCPLCESFVERAVKKCVDGKAGMIKRDETSIGYIVEALILSGIAIGLVGNSRPASGAEHHMAHYWEIDGIAKDYDHALHGNSVGVASVVIAEIYEMMKDRIPAVCNPPKPRFIADLLSSVQAHASPKTLGISRELFVQSVIHAKEIRDRYTILSLAGKEGLLPEYAELLARRYYGD